MKTLYDCIFVGIGGMLGAISRYLITLIPLKSEHGLPYLTLIINMSGAFLIGLIVALVDREVLMNKQMILFLKVGICGGFTTFSTFSLESYNLIQNGQVVLALAYMMLSALICLGAIELAQQVIH